MKQKKTGVMEEGMSNVDSGDSFAIGIDTTVLSKWVKYYCRGKDEQAQVE